MVSTRVGVGVGVGVGACVGVGVDADVHARVTVVRSATHCTLAMYPPFSHESLVHINDFFPTEHPDPSNTLLATSFMEHSRNPAPSHITFAMTCETDCLWWHLLSIFDAPQTVGKMADLNFSFSSSQLRLEWLTAGNARLLPPAPPLLPLPLTFFGRVRVVVTVVAVMVVDVVVIASAQHCTAAVSPPPMAEHHSGGASVFGVGADVGAGAGGLDS